MTISEQKELREQLRKTYSEKLADRHFENALDLYVETVWNRAKLAEGANDARKYLERILNLAAGAEAVDSSWGIQFSFRADEQARAALTSADEILETLEERLDSWEDGDVEDVFRVGCKTTGWYVLQALAGTQGAERLTDLVSSLQN